MPDAPTAPRIAPLEPPYDPHIETFLQKWMPPGSQIEPLALFRTLAIHEQLASRMRPQGAAILAHGTVDPRSREILIHRTCARTGAEYEWGVHVIAYGKAVGLSDAQIAATVHGTAEDPAWSDGDALLIRLADELHDTCTVLCGAVERSGRALQRGPAAQAADHGRPVSNHLLRGQRSRSPAGAVGRALFRCAVSWKGWSGSGLRPREHLGELLHAGYLMLL